MIEPIDKDWQFQIACIDGVSGFKIAPKHPVKRTAKKNRPWEYCFCIIKWWDDDGQEQLDKAIWTYDEFNQDCVIEMFNRWDWLYGRWKILTQGVCWNAKDIPQS